MLMGENKKEVRARNGPEEERKTQVLNVDSAAERVLAVKAEDAKGAQVSKTIGGEGEVRAPMTEGESGVPVSKMVGGGKRAQGKWKARGRREVQVLNGDDEGKAPAARTE